MTSAANEVLLLKQDQDWEPAPPESLTLLNISVEGFLFDKANILPFFNQETQQIEVHRVGAKAKIVRISEAGYYLDVEGQEYQHRLKVLPEMVSLWLASKEKLISEEKVVKRLKAITSTYQELLKNIQPDKALHLRDEIIDSNHLWITDKGLVDTSAKTFHEVYSGFDHAGGSIRRISESEFREILALIGEDEPSKETLAELGVVINDQEDPVTYSIVLSQIAYDNLPQRYKDKNISSAEDTLLIWQILIDHGQIPPNPEDWRYEHLFLINTALYHAWEGGSNPLFNITYDLFQDIAFLALQEEKATIEKMSSRQDVYQVFVQFLEFLTREDSYNQRALKKALEKNVSPADIATIVLGIQTFTTAESLTRSNFFRDKQTILNNLFWVMCDEAKIERLKDDQMMEGLRDRLSGSVFGKKS